MGGERSSERVATFPRDRWLRGRDRKRIGVALPFLIAYYGYTLPRNKSASILVSPEGIKAVATGGHMNDGERTSRAY